MSMKNEDESASSNMEGFRNLSKAAFGSDLSSMRAASPCMPHVVRVHWEPDDHVNELNHMLQGVVAENVDMQLVRYVENKIEPTGWRAVWTVPPNQPNYLFSLEQETCVYVDVIDVSREKLIAEVRVLKPVNVNILKDDLMLIEKCKNKVVHVPLMELSVLADQENEALDMVNTAEVICLIKFFYEHIWQPWDLGEENIYYSHSLITTRLQLFQDIQTAHIPSSVGARLRAVIREANSIQKEIKNTASKNKDDLDTEMDEKDVAHLFKLHEQLEKLKAQFEVLQDPILRELSNHPSQEEEVNIKAPYSKVKVVARALTTLQIMKHMAMLPELIRSLPQVTDEDLWQTYSTLQGAINAAHEGDVIILLPGQHSLCQLGLLLAQCGTLVGLGEGIVVEGKSENGDVLMDITGNFTIQNITLKPAPEQIGIVVHNGLTTMQNVVLKGGKWGLIGLENTELCISQVSIQDCSAGGLDFRDGAVASISSSSVKDCRIGIEFEEGAKISLLRTRIEHNKKYGVVQRVPEGTGSSSNKMSADTLLKSFMQNGTGNTVEQNTEDVAVIAVTPSSSRS